MEPLPLLSSAAALGAAVGCLSSLPPSRLTCGKSHRREEPPLGTGDREGGGTREKAAGDTVIALHRGLCGARAARAGRVSNGPPSSGLGDIQGWERALL